MERDRFQDRIRRIASRETSADPNGWTSENPLWGHCAVVSLLTQDIYGGDLLRASLEGTPWQGMRSHYWNKLPDGIEVDFTDIQFKGNKPILVGEGRTREYVLSYAETARRYQQLVVLFERNNG